MNPSQQHYATYNPQQQIHASTSAYAAQSGGVSAVLQAWVPPSPQEQQYYDLLFSHVDDQRRNAINGQQAVAFFARSHLDKTILREVWSIADVQRRSELSRNGFYVAMRLISMGQRGEQVSLQRFSHFIAMPYPLPMMEGVPLPLGMQQQPTQSQQSYTAQPIYGSPHQQPTGPYALTTEEKSKYDAVFQQYDTDRDGYLMGTEAVTLFQMSGLDRNVLRNIWSMADVTQDNRLSAQEFYVAMHLIVCVSKRGLTMPTTLPRELSESAFGSGGAAISTPGHGGLGPQMSRVPSQNGLPAPKQQERGPPPKPEGMSAFDSFSTAKDTPLPSLASSTPQTNSSNLADGSTMTIRTGGHGESSASMPTRGFGNFSSSQAPEVTSVNARTNSSSSVNLMSHFTGITALPLQPPVQQLSSRSFGSNERIQMPHTQTAGFQGPQQMYGNFGTEHFNAHKSSAGFVEKSFLGDEEDRKMVGQLDQLNEQVVQLLASTKRKQTTVEDVCGKMRDLDELRHELFILVMKREDLRSSTAIMSAAGGDVAKDQTNHSFERSLQSLVENQRQVVQQLKSDISGHEGELEEAILSAKLQQKLSLESRPLLAANESLPVSTHDSVGAAGGGFNANVPAPLALDDSNLLPSLVAAPSAPSMSDFTPNTTDSSGFNAFSNFDSAPRSIANATPSSTAEILSNSLFSPTPSPSQMSAARDSFNTFGDFASADATPSLPTDVMEPSSKSPFPLVSVDANDNTGFDAFGTAMVSTGTHVRPFSQTNPSPSTAVAHDFGIGGFGDFNGASSSLVANASESSQCPTAPSPAAINSLSADFCAAVDTAAKTETFDTSPFLTPSAMENLDFDAFAAAPISTDNATTCPNTRVATEKLLFPPVAADQSRSDTFGNGSVAPNDAMVVPESSESAENLLFSPTFVSAAPTSSGQDAFDDFGSRAVLTEGAASETAPETTTITSDMNDFDGFGDFNTALASADSAPFSFESGKPIEACVDPPSSLPAKYESNSDFEALGDFYTAPPSTSSATEMFEVSTAVNTLPFSPKAFDNNGSGNFEVFGDSFTAPVSISEMLKVSTAADTSNSSLTAFTADDNSGFSDFEEPSSAPVLTAKPLEMKSADEVLPVDTTGEAQFEEFGDYNTASASTNQIQPEVLNGSTNLEAFEDFSC